MTDNFYLNGGKRALIRDALIRLLEKELLKIIINIDLQVLCDSIFIRYLTVKQGIPKCITLETIEAAKVHLLAFYEITIL